MSHSESPRLCAGAAGFTLLELMLVLLLLGLLLAVGLRIDLAQTESSAHAQLEQLSHEFALATLEAVQAGALWGLDFHADGQGHGYRWLVYGEKGWVAADATRLGVAASERMWPAGMQSALASEGNAVLLGPPLPLAATANFQPDVLLLPTRENTAFTLTLQAPPDHATLMVDSLGRTTVQEATDATR